MNDYKLHETENISTRFHGTYNTWSFYAHLPNDTNWSIDSYQVITKMDTLEQCVATMNYIPDSLITSCMLFLMRGDIKPIWEDPKNKYGGCFSFKIPNDDICDVWRKTSWLLMSENIINKEIADLMNGITVSPKKHFCIFKVWLDQGEWSTFELFDKLSYLKQYDPIFKKHID